MDENTDLELKIVKVSGTLDSNGRTTSTEQLEVNDVEQIWEEDSETDVQQVRLESRRRKRITTPNIQKVIEKQKERTKKESKDWHV